jgi:RimJ/RimL family protein N-acetyltransferase
MLTNKTKKMCGHVELRLLGANGRIGEISFGLLESHRGHGYMSRALTSMFEHLGTNLGLETIVAQTRTSNTNCQTLLARLAFIATEEFEFEWMLGPCEASDITFVKTAPSLDL